MNNKFGFIITRHVNSDKTNNYWNHSIKLITRFYPLIKIVVIDDNSNYEYVKSEFDYKNVVIIQSEFPGRGELLPYYYFLKYNFFENAVIIHDSVFFHKRINFEILNGIDVMPLWFFHSDRENVENTKRIAANLTNNTVIYNKVSKDFNLLGMNKDKWYGCYGVQSYINLNFLKKIENKYRITNLLSVVKSRPDRCSLERIFGSIFCTESHKILKLGSIFGNIMKYQRWGYSYDEYIEDFKKGTIPKAIIKVWTGR